MDNPPIVLPPDEAARITRVFIMAIHALSVVRALHTPQPEMKKAAFMQALEMLDTHCRELYPDTPSDGIDEMKRTAEMFSLSLEVVEIPIGFQQSNHGPN